MVESGPREYLKQYKHTHTHTHTQSEKHLGAEEGSEANPRETANPTRFLSFLAVVVFEM